MLWLRPLASHLGTGICRSTKIVLFIILLQRLGCKVTTAPSVGPPSLYLDAFMT